MSSTQNPTPELNAIRLLEVRTAERDRAVELLDKLEAAFKGSAAGAEARAFLEQVGAREPQYVDTSPRWYQQPAPWRCSVAMATGKHDGNPCRCCGAVDCPGGL